MADSEEGSEFSDSEVESVIEEGELESNSPSMVDDQEYPESLSESEEDDVDPDRVRDDMLERLGKSELLKDLLRNPHLRNMLLELNESADPGVLLLKAMQIPIFTECAEECLNVCGFRTNDRDNVL